MTSEKFQKIVYIVFAVLAALAALLIQSRFGDAPSQGYQVEAEFRSQALGGVVIYEALQAVVSQPDFRTAFPHDLELNKVEETPHLLSVLVTVSTLEESESVMKALEKQLSKASVSLALSETTELVKNLEKIEPPVKSSRAGESPRKPSKSQRKQSLTAQERKKALKLSIEREDLERFLKGGPAPTWLPRRLTQSVGLPEAEAELRRLKQAFRTENKSVRAQESEVVRLKTEVRKSRRQLAQALLSSHKQELSRLDNKAFDTIAHNAKVEGEREKEPPRQAVSGSEEWIRGVKARVEADKKALAEAAEFRLAGPVITSRLEGDYYWSRVTLWLAAVLFLVLALFRSDSESAASPSLAKQGFHYLRKDYGEKSTALELEAEPLLLQLVESVKTKEGHAARHYLILGSSENDARTVVTVRIAKTLSSLGRKVRLVDFDLRNKVLSSKLGNRNTAGVSDFLASNGVLPEEFLAPLEGTTMELAPAGNAPLQGVSLGARKGLRSLLRPDRDCTVFVDASFDSPLAILLEHVDAVICVTSKGNQWSQEQQEVLVSLKQAEMPIWGLVQGDKGIHPFT